MVKKSGSPNMTMLYPNPCYNEECILGIIFFCSCCLLIFFKINFIKKIFQEHYAKLFRSRSGPLIMFCRSWPGSKLFGMTKVATTKERVLRAYKLMIWTTRKIILTDILIPLVSSTICKIKGLLVLCGEVNKSGLFPAILGKGPWPNLGKNDWFNIKLGRN